MTFFVNPLVAIPLTCGFADLWMPQPSSTGASPSAEVTCLSSLPRAAFFVTGDASGGLALHFGARAASVRLRVTGAAAISAVAMARGRGGTIEVFFASGLALFRLAPPNWSYYEDGAELSE